ncbi:Trehalose-6-phosphate phosphatase [Gammaproteobacteria bacterium]
MERLTDASQAVPVLEQNSALFLDVDGTLIPIKGSPSEAWPDAQQIALLKALHQALNGAMALVSGRPLVDIDRLYHPLCLPAAGQHGVEIRDGAGRRLDQEHPGDNPLASIRKEVLDHFGDVPGILIEDKGHCLAIHYRLAPEQREAIKITLGQLLSDRNPDLVMQAGKMVFELKPAHTDKGLAIQAFMDIAPFAGKKPVFVGDDVTDEDGFMRVNQLGGDTIKVGPGTTQAKYRLADAESVRNWLQFCLAHLRNTK